MFLCIFSVMTYGVKEKLVSRLSLGFQAPLTPLTPPPRSQRCVVPVPDVMFKLTPTYFSRVFNADVQNAVELFDSLGTRPDGAVWPTSGSMQQSRVRRSVSHVSLASGRSNASATSASSSIDQAGITLAFRGSPFSDIVEQENVCFICYDRSPESPWRSGVPHSRTSWSKRTCASSVTTGVRKPFSWSVATLGPAPGARWSCRTCSNHTPSVQFVVSRSDTSSRCAPTWRFPASCSLGTGPRPWRRVSPKRPSSQRALTLRWESHVPCIPWPPCALL